VGMSCLRAGGLLAPEFLGMKKGPELVFSSPGLDWLLADFCHVGQHTLLKVLMQPHATAVVLTCPL